MNVVFVNPYSGGGMCVSKWKSIRQELGNNFKSFYMNNNGTTAEFIKKNYSNGNTDFIAAGGDGTVNYLLNKLITSLTPSELNKVKLGAIGLGSSNDFQKPFNECKYLNNFPARIDFDKAVLRDIGCITYLENNVEHKKYFLINASIGITAEANKFFNNPDKLLSVSKKSSTGIAILYAAIKSIISYRNFNLKIHSSETGEFLSRVTNIGITKNPNFSGNLKYKSTADYTNGNFDVFLCADMTKPEIFSLLYLLSRGKFDKVEKKTCWNTNQLTVTSDKPFNIEYDGEILITQKAVLSILPKYLKVCTC